MSFSLEVKEELSKLSNLSNKKEVEYELKGYLLTTNAVKVENTYKYSTENEYNINRFAKLLKNMNINKFEINLQGKIYSITVNAKTIEKIINKIEIEKIENEELKALIRGIFLGSGSISNPENSYHLEYEVKNIEEVKEILEKTGIKFKIMKNKIYVKEGEEISKFLAYIGANKSVLRFEEIRVQRDMNNKVNRLVNCKTANLNKVINASVEQISAIKKLKETGEFEKLDDLLKEIANLRLENPEMSLIELGQNLQKPIGKSGVNYRLKKIIDLSKEN